MTRLVDDVGVVPPAQVLIPEARRRQRRRARVTTVLLVVAALVGVSVAMLGARGPSGLPQLAGGPSVPLGAVATVDRLGRGSSIWVVDMRTADDGYGIAGRGNAAAPAYLVATTDGGRVWRLRSLLPYGVVRDTTWVPSLQFVTATVGYTQSGIGTSAADRAVYVTTDGGRSWHPLALDGVTPTAAGDNLGTTSANESYQIAGGVVSVVTLQCTAAALMRGGSVCPATLERLRVGARRPFAHWRIPALGSDDRPALSDRLLAAVSATTVIVAEGDLEGWSPVLISRTGGRAWSTWSTPCGALHVGRFTFSLPVQELDTFSPTRWVLDCFQGGGMSQGSLVVSASADQGRSWRLRAAGSEGATDGGIRTVGNVGDRPETLWASDSGRVLWAWDSIQGFFTESTDGGHLWRAAPGVPSYGLGWTVDLSPFGPSGAVLLASGRAYVTEDGTRWHHVRLLAIS